MKNELNAEVQKAALEYAWAAVNYNRIGKLLIKMHDENRPRAELDAIAMEHLKADAAFCKAQNAFEEACEAKE